MKPWPRSMLNPDEQVPERPTEDDIAKAKLGEQGVPGKPPKPPVASPDALQIPNHIDPGHTA